MNITRVCLLPGLLSLLSMILQGQEKSGPAPLALSMRDAIRLALTAGASPTVGIAEESVRAAEARLREGRSGLLPQIDTTLTTQNQVLNLSAEGFEGVHLPVPGFSFPRSVGPFETVDARVHVRQELFDWAAINRSRAGRAGIETAKTVSEDAREQIAGQVARLYLAAQRAAGGIGTAEALVAAAEATLQEVSNRDNAGKALGIDVAHARVRLAVEKQHLLESRMDQARANVELLSALNRDLDTPLDVTDPLVFAPQQTPRPEQALADALRSRSDVAAQKRRVQEARLSDTAIHSERIPSVTAYADMGSLGTTVPNSVGTYDVGVALRIPVFDGGRRDARREETRSAIRQEELRAAQIERQVALEVRQALIELDMTRGQVETADQEIDVARQELDHRRRSHEQGLGGQIEVSEAQAGLAQAMDGRVAAVFAWNEARIELMQAMGSIRSLAQ